MRGAAAYAGDLAPAGLAHVRLVLCPHAAAVIGRVETAAAERAPGVLAVVAGADLAGAALPPLLLLARDRASFAGQPVAAVIAQTEAAAADAATLVEVDYQPLPAVVDPLRSLDAGAPAVLEGRPNVTDHDRLELGDVEAELAGCSAVVEGRYTLPPVHQAPLETHVVVAEYRAGAGFTVWTPTQSLFVTQQLTAAALGVAGVQVRVVPTPVGGGFGGKLGVLLEPLAAWLARSAGRPVRLALTRAEEFLCSGRATGCVIDLRLGADSGGRLRGLSARVLVDQGAGPGFPARRVGVFLARPYHLAAYRIDCTGVMTNTPPANAYRGQPGALACFALESAVDELATRLGVDPVELRLASLRQEGELDPAGGVWPRMGGRECLEAARPLLERMGPPAALAYGLWDGYEGGAGAGCRLNPDGSLTVQLGTPDVSGTHTALAMLAADTFGLPLARVAVELADSSTAPHSVPAGGSAVIHVVGQAVAAAAADAQRQLLEIAAEEMEAAVEDLELAGGVVHVRGVPERSRTLEALAAAIYGWHSHHPPVLGVGRVQVADPAPMAAVHVARVAVDAATGAWRLDGYAAVHDVGRALNPAEVEGQVHGGALQGIGRAFGEELVWDTAGAATASFLTYEVPTVELAPDLEVSLVEVPAPLGALGVRGAGEPPIIPGPPAIASSLARATGIRLRRLPLTAQNVWRERALAGRAAADAGDALAVGLPVDGGPGAGQAAVDPDAARVAERAADDLAAGDRALGAAQAGQGDQ